MDKYVDKDHDHLSTIHTYIHYFSHDRPIDFIIVMSDKLCLLQKYIFTVVIMNY